MDKGATASGAKGVVAFQQYSNNGSLPHGLYFDYMFATGSEKELFFAPKFSAAISTDPLTGKREHWLSMGLNSKLDGAGLDVFGGRPNLNAVIVLDVSGSMQCGFNSPEDMQSTKLAVAKLAITEGLFPQFTDDDSFALISFTESASVRVPLTHAKSNQTLAVHSINGLVAGGGTCLSAGMRAASEIVDGEYQKKTTRIFYFTDMCPNHESSDSKSMLSMMEDNAANGVFTTFVGIGVDFNSALVSKFARVKGCNWFCVQSPKAFKKLMNEDFKYIVTPAAFDIKSIVQADASFTVDRIYGSPSHTEAQEGVLCEVNSIFPSQKESETLTKGGVVVIRLNAASTNVATLTKYFDPKGTPVRFTSEVKFKNEEYWEDDAVRKAVLLTRYVTFTKEYLKDVAAIAANQAPPSTLVASGLVDLKQAKTVVDVQTAYKPLYEKFKTYYGTESEHLQDPQLVKTFDLLTNLFSAPPTASVHSVD